jgi:hypothetical protein
VVERLLLLAEELVDHAAVEQALTDVETMRAVDFLGLL